MPNSWKQICFHICASISSTNLKQTSVCLQSDSLFVTCQSLYKPKIRGSFFAKSSVNFLERNLSGFESENVFTGQNIQLLKLALFWELFSDECPSHVNIFFFSNRSLFEKDKSPFRAIIPSWNREPTKLQALLVINRQCTHGQDIDTSTIKCDCFILHSFAIFTFFSWISETLFSLYVGDSNLFGRDWYCG